MGNSHPQQPSFLLDASNIQDWYKVQQQAYAQLWINKKTNQQLQAYPIPQSFVRNQDQLQKYQFRKAHRQNLVVVEAIVTPGNSSFCSEPRTAYALVQNITARLSEFKNSLSFEQALYVLSVAAAGYNTLNSFFGPLQPHPEMICFNEQGQVKVWLNQNLALNEPSQAAKSANYPSDDYNIAQKRTKQGVNKLIRIVQQASANQFSSPFKEECKKVSTYFQTANMISYFCYAYHIQLPSNIIVFKNLQNPPVNLQKVMMKKESHHSFQANPTSLESSRVKTILFRSSHIQQRESKQQLINPVVSRSIDQQHSIKLNVNPRIPQNIAHSPKITFSIRSTLPTQPNQQKFEGVLFGKPVFKTSVSHSNFFGSPVSVMRSPQEPKVHIRLQEIRRSTSLGEGIMEGKAINLEINKQQIIKVSDSSIPHKQLLEQVKTSEINIAQNTQIQNKIELRASLQQSFKQKNVNQFQQAQTMANQVVKQERLQQNIEQYKDNIHIAEEHRQVENKQPQTSYPYTYSQDYYQEKDIKLTSYFEQPEDNHNHHQSKDEKFRDYSEDHINAKENFKTSAILDLKKLVHEQNYGKEPQPKQLEENSNHQSDQSIKEDQQPHDKSQLQEYIIKESRIENSAYLNNKKCSMPYQQLPIFEQLEENHFSPSKDHTEIQEWEARLTKFTQSKHSQHNEPEQKTIQLQKLSEKVYVPTVQSKRQVILKEQPQEQPSNQLAHLDEQGIQEYIRKKYNLYNNQNTSYEEKHDQPIRSLTHQRVSYSNQPDRPSYDYYNMNDGQTQYTQPKISYRSSRNENNIESYRTKDYTIDVYQKQNHYPEYQQTSNNRPQVTQNHYACQQTKATRKQVQRTKYRASQMTKIDERYNKYVVNANRARPSAGANRPSMSKDVSQMFRVAGGDSKISRFSPKPIVPQLQESVRIGQDLFRNDIRSPKIEVTYQKLRKLLWSQ